MPDFYVIRNKFNSGSMAGKGSNKTAWLRLLLRFWNLSYRDLGMVCIKKASLS